MFSNRTTTVRIQQQMRVMLWFVSRPHSDVFDALSAEGYVAPSKSCPSGAWGCGYVMITRRFEPPSYSIAFRNFAGFHRSHSGRRKVDASYQQE